MRIRKARAGDERSIAAVIIDTWKVAYRGILPEGFLGALTTEKHEKLFKKNIADAKETVLVLENVHKEIVGVVSGGQDRSGKYDCELVAIYVLPDYQKKGFGKQLFKAFIEEQKRSKYKSMIVWAFRENRDKGFYKKLGGLVREEKSYPFAGNELPIEGYTWEDIHTVK